MDLTRLITTVDVHVAGEPLRIITGGLPEIKGDTQPERRAYAIKNLDHIRKMLMNEPRGHRGMYGCIMTPPTTGRADFGVLFMHNQGWSTMCGHGIIAVITMGVETGKFEVENNNRTFVIDSPAGEVIATVKCNANKVEEVSFENVPSFVYKKDFPVKIGSMEFYVDIAFGGAFYAILDSEILNLQVSNTCLTDLQDWGKKIKDYVEKNLNVQHPLQDDLKNIYGVIFSDKPNIRNADLRNVTIFADRQVDRSPCGTGTSARVATLFERDKLKKGDIFVHESITGGIFKSQIIKHTKVDKYDAVIPKITGIAHITGFHQFLIDSRDDMSEGFAL